MIVKNIGFAFCGSYCTFDKAIGALEKTAEIYAPIMPIMSENAYSTDTRFGTAKSFVEKIETICGKTVTHTIRDAEPIGPQELLDILVIAPCTGNTIAKLASGVTDTCVTMAAKAHLRSGRPVVIAVSTNDGLSGNAANIGRLLNRKNIYIVPYYQDDPIKKPFSVTADFTLIPAAIEAALKGVQLQPVLRAMPTTNV